MASALEELPWVKDVDTSLDSGDDEIHVVPRRARALQSGLSTQAVAATVSSALTTRPVSQIRTDDREVDLVVQFREEDRRTLAQLRNFPIGASVGPSAHRGAGRLLDRERPEHHRAGEPPPRARRHRQHDLASTNFRMMGEVQDRS